MQGRFDGRVELHKKIHRTIIIVAVCSVAFYCRSYICSVSLTVYTLCTVIVYYRSMWITKCKFFLFQTALRTPPKNRPAVKIHRGYLLTMQHSIKSNVSFVISVLFIIRRVSLVHGANNRNHFMYKWSLSYLLSLCSVDI